MKEEIKIEYPLENASENFLWKIIGDPLGLASWFSEEITVNENEYTFYWNDQSLTATKIAAIDKKFIQFQWEEDYDTDCFFKIEILTHPLSANISLQITDFAVPDDEADVRLLWDKHIDDLKRKAGI